MTLIKEETPKKCSFEDAMDLTGFGKYNIAMLITCCLLILAMYLDIFGLSVAMPAAACDLDLSTSQQGLLSAVPLIGVMISSYAWGLCADTLGRRATILLAMPVGSVFSLAASMAPTYASLAVLKFLSAACTSSANAAGFVLLGESVPRKFRSRFMFLMTTATMLVQLFAAILALPILSLTFRLEVPLLNMEYRPWRMLLQVICFPGILGSIFIVFLNESPKFLLCKNKERDSLDVLKLIYSSNNGMKKDSFPVETVFLDDLIQNTSTSKSFLRKMWQQTAPLFKPPLLKNSMILYYLLLCAYMTSTGYTMWVPTLANAYFTGEDKSGLTFCQVASQSEATSNSTTIDCDNAIQPMALYATMVYSGCSGTLSITLGSIVGHFGKKTTTILVFVVSILCGFLLLFIRIPLLSLSLFFIFLYVAIILGNVNTFLVELNPTHLRGMATCLSVVVARGFGFFSVQLIASLIGSYCTPMISGYVVLVSSGLVVALFLPSDKNEEKLADTKVPKVIENRENKDGSNNDTNRENNDSSNKV